MTFLILVVIFIIALPYIGRLLNRLIIWFFTHQMERQVRQAYDRTYGGDQRGTGRQQTQSSAPPERRGKRIDPSVGEYVEYEEIEGAASAAMSESPTTETFVSETQITDAEWEEIA